MADTSAHRRMPLWIRHGVRRLPWTGRPMLVRVWLFGRPMLLCELIPSGTGDPDGSPVPFTRLAHKRR